MRKLLGFISLVLTMGVMPVAAHAQRTDLSGDVSVSKGLIPITRANTAATGAWVDLANYDGAIVIAQSGLMDAATQYLVVQDSFPGSAVANVDSVAVSVDSTTSAVAYRGKGRYLRVLLRASGGASDSSWVSAAIVRSGGRKR